MAQSFSEVEDFKEHFGIKFVVLCIFLAAIVEIPLEENDFGGSHLSNPWVGAERPMLAR